MALKQGSARESKKKKSSNGSSGNKMPPDRDRTVRREPLGAAASASRGNGKSR